MAESVDSQADVAEKQYSVCLTHKIDKGKISTTTVRPNTLLQHLEFPLIVLVKRIPYFEALFKIMSNNGV